MNGQRGMGADVCGIVPWVAGQPFVRPLKQSARNFGIFGSETERLWCGYGVCCEVRMAWHFAAIDIPGRMRAGWWLWIFAVVF